MEEGGKVRGTAPTNLHAKGRPAPGYQSSSSLGGPGSRALYSFTGSTNCGRLPHLSRKEPGSSDHHLDRFLFSRDQRTWMLKKRP